MPSPVTHVPSTDIYYLSGIGYQAYTKQYGQSCFRVPMDPTKAVIGRVQPDLDGFQVYNCSYIPPGCHVPGTHIGFPIHMRCWSLAKIKLGPAVEQNLGLFWAVLRDRFWRLIGELPLPVPIADPGRLPSVREIRRAGVNVWYRFESPIKSLESFEHSTRA